MPYAQFPAANYLSNAVRTEGEMKTAFENWLDACKDTQGFGQCVVTAPDPTFLAIWSRNGRVVVANQDAVFLAQNAQYPVAPIASIGANVAVILTVTTGASFIGRLVGAGAAHASDAATGVEVLTTETNLSVIALFELDAALHFNELQLANWFHRRLRATQRYINGGSTSSTTYVPVTTIRPVNWALEYDVVAADLFISASVATTITLGLFSGTTEVYNQTLAVAPGPILAGFGPFPIAHATDGGLDITVKIRVAGAAATITWSTGSITVERHA